METETLQWILIGVLLIGNILMGWAISNLVSASITNSKTIIELSKNLDRVIKLIK